MKHTKGHWSTPHLSIDESECNCGYVLAESGQYCGAIAKVFWSKDRELENGDNPPLEEAKYNAKLISAAPDLLEAINKAMSIVELWTYGNDVSEEHSDEAVVLNEMKRTFENVIKKATEL